MFPPYYIWPVYQFFGGMPAYQQRPTVTRPPKYKPVADDEDVIFLAWYYMLNGRS